MKHKQTNKLWGAAFSQNPSEAVIAFTAGRDVQLVAEADAALLTYDLWLNKAHAAMLGKTGCIPASDAGKLLKGLLELEHLAESGVFVLDPSKEDVHTNIESWLTEKLGIDVAGLLHTARSRNDQAATDTKLYLRDQVLAFIGQTSVLVQTLLTLADRYKTVPMPGFTHHQHAMVTTFGHVCAGFAEMLVRDIGRFTGWYALHNTSPLGSMASYGTSFPIDRTMTAAWLGFDGPDHNSLDVIMNRGEAESDLALAVVQLMNHLSLIAETLIVFGTPEFGMVTLSDTYSTGSSVMPQKKNPDPLEVIKGKTAFAQGQLMGLLSMGKGRFIGYNRDSQWTKYLVMDLVRECLSAPTVLVGVLETMAVHEGVMEQWCHKGYIGATVLMEQLIHTLHLPMRVAKLVVETAVKQNPHGDQITYVVLQQALAGQGVTLSADGLPSGLSESQVAHWQDPMAALSLNVSYGGPGKHSMKKSIKQLAKKLAGHTAWLMKKQHEQVSAKKLLNKAIQSMVTPYAKATGAKGGE